MSGTWYLPPGPVPGQAGHQAGLQAGGQCPCGGPCPGPCLGLGLPALPGHGAMPASLAASSALSPSGSSMDGFSDSSLR